MSKQELLELFHNATPEAQEKALQMLREAARKKEVTRDIPCKLNDTNGNKSRC